MQGVMTITSSPNWRSPLMRLLNRIFMPAKMHGTGVYIIILTEEHESLCHHSPHRHDQFGQSRLCSLHEGMPRMHNVAGIC